MEKVKRIFDELKATSSKTGKEQILRNNEENELLLTTLVFLLNPFITTGLSDKKINKNVERASPVQDFKTAVDIMEYLAQHNTGTDRIIASVQYFISNQPEHMWDFYRDLFTKSLKLGCAANTVNKVFGKNFIPQFEVMLAEKYFDYADKVRGRNFSITLKVDGIRAVCIKKGNSIEFFSRQGQLIDELVEIENELAGLLGDFVLDGELLVTNTRGIPSKEQYKATTKIVRKDGEKRGITYHVFDYLEVENFVNQVCGTPYETRRALLEQRFSNLKYTKILPVLYNGNDFSQVIKLLDDVRAEREEGLMVNINTAPYEFKRSQNLLKVKVMQTCDLEIIGFEEGQGRLAGMLGCINVNYKGNVLGVGSGFSDEERIWFWENQDELLGRIIEISYFEETQDKDGNLSCRFPVYKRLREVGKEVSYV